MSQDNHSLARYAASITLLFGLLCCLRVAGAPASGSDALHADFPKVRIIRDDATGLLSIYGTHMTSADSPIAAVAEWLDAYGESLGIVGLDVSDATVRTVGHGPLRVIALGQTLNGIPVINALARFVIAEDGGQSTALYVGARLAQREVESTSEALISANDALVGLQSFAGSHHLRTSGDPELVIRFEDHGSLLERPRKVWRIHATTLRSPIPQPYSLYLDAQTGELLDPQNEMHSAGDALSVRGSVRGYASPATNPDSTLYPPVDQPVNDARIYTDLGETTFSDLLGRYSFIIEPPDSSALQANIIGPWINIVDAEGPTLELASVIDRSTPKVTFVFNESQSEFATAQLNAFIHANVARRFYRQRQPDFTELDRQTTCTVNLGSGNACGGGFDPVSLSLIFTRASDHCVNSAYSTVVTHEYAHFIVNRLELPTPQGPFGEGFADTVSLLVYDDPAVGRDYTGPDTVIRDIVPANQQYPCLGVDHTCGQVLAGVWWDIKLALQEKYGTDEGQRIVRQLFSNWSRITLGGNELDSAHPITVVELLTVADDDGEFDTLTPYFHEICEGFAQHNLACPISDCNSNGIDDSADLDSGFSDDCTSNGIPDECERDCNGNTRADSCDIADGTAADLDGNGVPDACQSTLIVPDVDFPTIQSAIDAAQPGDTILVSPGVYRGVQNKNLDLLGKTLYLGCETPGACVLDCERDGRGFFFHRDETPATIVDGFTIINGSPSASPFNGAGIHCFDSSPTIRNCTIRDCVTAHIGGGMWIRFAHPIIESCLFADNRARGGGAIAVSLGTAEIRQSTIAGNTATTGNAISVLSDGYVELRNSIVWNHGPRPDSGIATSSDGARITYSLIERGWAGDGNIDGDPLFMDSGSGDYRLRSGSPCVNIGDPNATPSTTVDALGNPRLQGCRIDLGAFESNEPQELGDFDHSRTWDLEDVAAFQICFDPSMAESPQSNTCQCVFDQGTTPGVGNDDLPTLLNLLTGP